MTQIARDDHISRTFLYQLSWAAKHHWEDRFRDPQHLVEPPDFLIEPWSLVLRLAGNGSLPSLSSIFKHFDYQPNSVGSLSAYLPDSGRSVPSTLSMPEKKVVFSLSDEIFALRAPILVTIDAQSTTILKSELAADRSAKPWETPGQALGAHRFHRLGLASDRGVGLKAGYQAACQDGCGVCEQFPAFQDLYNRCHHLERKADGAIAGEHEAAEQFANAKSEANRPKRLEPSARARQACEHAIERYDQLAVWLSMLSETCPLGSGSGRLRTVEGVRSDLTLILSLMEDMDEEKLPKLLQPLRAHIDDSLVPFRQVAQMHSALLELLPEPLVDAFALAWHHDPLC
jgi:hypothetical protein